MSALGASPRATPLPETRIAIRLVNLGTFAVFLGWLAAACWALAYIVSH